MIKGLVNTEISDILKPFDPASGVCQGCGKALEVGEWPFCPHGETRSSGTAAHPSERAVVWEHPGTGQIRYPGRNDVPIPERYAKEGFVRREMPTLRDIHAFERERGVKNEKAWFDNGSGRSFTE